MKRQLAILDYSLGAMRRRRARTIAITSGLAFVVGLMASVVFLTGALRGEFEAGARELPDLTVQHLVAGRPALIDSALAARLHDIPAVRSVTPRVWGYFFMPALSGNLTIVGVDPARPSIARAMRRAIRAGRPLARRSGETVLGETLAGFLGVRIGDSISLPIASVEQPRFLRIVGLFRHDTALRTADVLLVGEDDARALLGVPASSATDIAIALTNPDEAAVVAEEIAARVPSARVLDKKLLRRTYALTFDERGGLVAAMLLPALAALLLLAWDRLTGIGEAERREIGILKAIGWETADVLAARVWESALVAGAGTVTGLLAAYVYVFALRAPGLAGALFGWSAIYPALDLAPRIELGDLASIAAAVVVPFVAVSIVPSWRAAMLDPDRAMRGLA